MINENKSILKAEIKQDESTIEQKIYSLTEKFYEANYYIINCKEGYLWWHILSLIIEYLQLISFIYDETLMDLWKKPELVTKIKTITNYLFIVPLIKYNKIIYLTILNIIMILIICFAIFTITIILIEKFNIKNNKRLLITYRTIIEGTSFTFFGHLIFLISTIFTCANGKTYFDQNMQCKSGLWYKIDSILGIICAVLLILVSIFCVSTLFIPSFVSNDSINDVLKKTNNIIDKSFTINKLLIATVFLLNKSFNLEWEVIIILLISTGIHLYNIFYYKSYENAILLLLHKFLGFSLFWGICSFTIGKIFNNWNFDGGLYLFFTGLVLIVIYFFHKSKNEDIMDFYSVNFNYIDSSVERLYYIKKYLNLLQNKSKDRSSNIIFHSLIGNKEDYCIKVNCKLKQYLELSSQGYESNYLLLQYCQQLFELALIRFPNDVILKCNYIIFLVIYLNKKKLAYRLLSTLNMQLYNFQDNYIIFYCKKYIEKCCTLLTKNDETQINKNILKSLEYKNLFNEFLNQLNAISSLYLEFWSSLLNYHLQGADNLTKLNELGSKINKLIDKINNNFERLHLVKSDDLKVVKLYYIFVKDILNDKAKCMEVKKMMVHFSNKVKIDDREIDYKNFDLRILSDNDDYRYLLLTTHEKKMGTIIDISLNSCKIFGYTKSELIGKDLNILIPEIYHKRHTKMFFEYTINHKNVFYESLYQKKEYKLDCYESFTHGINKSKYLVPIYYKAYLVQTEESDVVIITEFSKEEDVLSKKQQFLSNKNNFNNLNVKNSEDCCCVLTDKNFIIQEFTANSVEILGLNSSVINSNYYIINFIKQFNDEIIVGSNHDEISNNEATAYQEYSNSEMYGVSQSKSNTEYVESSNTPTVENQIQNAKMLINEEFRQPKKIIWKYSTITNILNNIYQKTAKNKSNILLGKNNSTYKLFNLKTDSDKTLLLEIDESKVTGKVVGYKFYFKKINVKTTTKINNTKKKLLSKTNIKPVKTKFIDKEKDKKPTFLSDSSNDNNKKENHNSSVENKSNKDSLIQIEESNNDSEDIAELINQNIERIKTKSNFKTVNYLGEKKEIKYANSENSLRDKNLFVVNQNIIPKTNFNFNLDINNMSYIGTQKIIDSNKLNNSLRELADNKIKLYEKQNQNQEIFLSSSDYTDEENEEYSSYSYSNSSESNENSSEEGKNQSPRKNKSDKFNVSHKKTSTKSNPKKSSYSVIKGSNKMNDANDYYKIKDLNKIRFMEFDFDKEMIVENEKFEKKSEVENILTNYKSKIFNQLDKDAKFPSIDLKNYQIRKRGEGRSEKVLNGNAIKEVKSNKKDRKKYVVVLDKENELLKYIKDALNRNNNEQTIVQFSIIAFISFLIILVAISMCLYFILKSLQQSKKSIFLLKNSVNMRYYYSMGVYYIRELILLNMKNNVTGGNYTNIPSHNKTNYTSKLSNLIKEIFVKSQNNLENILGTKMTYYKNTYQILNGDPLTTKIFYEQTKSRNITSNLITAIIQVNSAFNLLVITPTQLKQTSVDLFNFMYNTLNEVGKGLETIIQIFIINLDHRYYKNSLVIFIFLPVMFLVFILIFHVTGKYFLLIARRKSSYTAVFYGIGISLIKSSIKKCEIFMNELNKNDLSIYKEKDESQQNDNSSGNSILKNKASFEEKNENINQNTQNNNKNFDQSNNINGFKIKIIIFLLLIYIAMLLTSIFYLKFLGGIGKYELYGYHMQRFHNGLLNLFNCYREFLFDNNTIVFGDNAYNSLKELEQELYYNNTEDISYLEVNQTIINSLSKKYSELFQRDLCSFKNEDYFSSDEDCISFMGGIISLGFYNLATFFIEDIRINRNMAKYSMDNGIYIGNLTRVGMESWENETLLLNNTNNTKFRMELFNNYKIHAKMNIMFINVILPFIENQKNMTLTEIDNVMTSVDKTYIIIYSILYVLVFAYIFGFWIPKIKNFKDVIYKTKKMLSIIPKQILALQSSIRSLLDIPEDT